MDQIFSVNSHQSKSLEDYLAFANRVSTHDKALFAKEIAAMLEAGLHLTQAIAIIKKQIKNKYFAAILDDIDTEIKEGKQLSIAMQKYPNIFDPVMINITKAGEASGQLDRQLKELGIELENQNKFYGKIRGALIYPIFVLIVMLGIAILATVKIIPSIRGIVESSGAQLPWSTRVVMAFSGFLINQWYVAILIIIILAGTIWFLVKSPAGQVIKDRWLIKEPSGMFAHLYVSRFTRTLGLLISAGVPIVEAVRIVADVFDNHVYAESLTKVSSELERGIPISAALQEDPLFPDYVTQMIIVGEQTGQLDKVLLGLAAHYEEQTDGRVAALTALFEPAIIVIIGVGVGFLVFSILIPIYNATNSIGG